MLFAGKVPLHELSSRRVLQERSPGGDQQYSVTLSNRRPQSPLAELLSKAIARTIAGDNKLPAALRNLHGMSGQVYRALINNIVEAHDNPRYLEIGCWSGSTATAALYGNAATRTCIDNWSEYGGPKAEFFSNMDMVRSDKIEFNFIEQDFRSVDYSAIGTFNIYMFDGPHREVDQYDGIRLAQPALESPYLLIVDDWNFVDVRNGTFRGLIDTGSEIDTAMEVRTTIDNSHAKIAFEKSDWHNGCFIGVVRKRAP